MELGRVNPISRIPVTEQIHVMVSLQKSGGHGYRPLIEESRSKNPGRNRLKAGLKQEDLEEYGISWKHYQRIESGATNTTIKVLYKLAKAFKCRPGDLIP